ncbi:hypothetical protein [Frankia sp. CcWB3]
MMLSITYLLLHYVPLEPALVRRAEDEKKRTASLVDHLEGEGEGEACTIEGSAVLVEEEGFL